MAELNIASRIPCPYDLSLPKPLGEIEVSHIPFLMFAARLWLLRLIMLQRKFVVVTGDCPSISGILSLAIGT